MVFLEDKTEENGFVWKDFQSFAVMLGIFYSIAIVLWWFFDSIFYLVNFTIIGASLGLGFGLWPVFSSENKHLARKISQVLVGGYMFLV